jgi:hypothetical protein
MDGRIKQATVENIMTTAVDPMTIACQLAGHGEVRSVHVVSRQRPTYEALLRCRRLAAARDLDLTVDAAGVSVRSRRAADHPLTTAPSRTPGDGRSDWRRSLGFPRAGAAVRPLAAWGAAVARGVPAKLDRIRRDGRARLAGFAAMSEGTR